MSALTFRQKYDSHLIQFQFILKLQIMPIILNEEQESFKYDLLKQSLREEARFRLNKNYSFSNEKHQYSRRKPNLKGIEEDISEWSNNSAAHFNPKSKKNKFLLPQMKRQRRSQNIEDLSRQLQKYEQFNSDQIQDQNNFRLSFLKQMTKINFKRQTTKATEKASGSPKKINIKLQFPDRYLKLGQEKEQQKGEAEKKKFSPEQGHQLNGSFYTKRSSGGLIPSIKKLVSSSFPKKSMFRSESQRDPYQRTKFILNKNEWQDAKKNITEQIQQKFLQKQKQQRDRRVKLARLQRKLPLNFLSYSHKKQAKQRQSENQKSTEDSDKKRKNKSPYLVQLHMNSYNSKIEKINDSLLYEHKKLSQCIFLSNKKAIEPKQH